MEKQEPLRSKRLLCGLLWLIVTACQPKQPPAESQKIPTPAVYVAADSSGWQHREGRLWLNNKLFSGWRYELSSAGDTVFVGAYAEGRAGGTHRQWYANRKPKEIRQYSSGWQEGEQRGWHESGKPAFVYHFQHDVYEGRLQEWYANGQPARDSYYHEGHEAGPQQMWYADGSLKANYVARNGRNYGFTGVKNCVNVWDSIHVSH